MSSSEIKKMDLDTIDFSMADRERMGCCEMVMHYTECSLKKEIRFLIADLPIASTASCVLPPI